MEDPVADSTSREARMAELVERYGGALTRVCRGYELDPGCQEELRQEILLALWRALPAFRGDASLKTWTLRIAHNIAFTHAARRRRRTELPSSTLDPVSDTPGVDETLERKARRARLAAAITQLGDLDRQVVLLSLEDLPQKEIAAITGLSPTNISTRLSRARAALVKAVGGKR